MNAGSGLTNRQEEKMKIITQGQKVECRECGRELPEHKTRRLGSEFVCHTCINGQYRKRTQLQLRELTTETIERERLLIAGRFQ